MHLTGQGLVVLLWMLLRSGLIVALDVEIVMSIAMNPLSQPPFPLEKIEEMTALMGGEGQMYAK